MSFLSPRCHDFPRRHDGFTLMEMAVSILVVASLATVLFCSVSLAMERARRAGCLNNIRTQLVGLLSYASDHGDRYYWPAADKSADNAPEFLYPDYVGSLDAFLCPSTNNQIRSNVINTKTGKPLDLRNNAADARDARGGHSYEYFGFYGIPAAEVRLEWIGDKFYARKRPGHPYLPPEQTVLVLDGDDSGVNNVPDPANNHGAAGWNQGFADGHVRWVTRRDTLKHSGGNDGASGE